LVGGNGDIYTGAPWITGRSEQPYWVSDNGKIYIGNEGDTQFVEELEIKELKYYIQSISSDKTEIRLMPLDINLSKYKTEFAELYTDEETYISLKEDGSGFLTFDNPTIPYITFNQSSNDSGFTDLMIGGILTVKNMYIIGETVERQTIDSFRFNDVNPYLLDNGQSWGPSDETRWDQSLHSDATRVVGANNEIVSYGMTGWNDNLFAGYFAKIVEDEGFGGSRALKFINQNDQFGVGDRTLALYVYLKTPASAGVSLNDKIKVSFKQKSNIDDSGIGVAFQYDTPLEDMPINVPTGFDREISNTQIPTLSPQGQWS